MLSCSFQEQYKFWKFSTPTSHPTPVILSEAKDLCIFLPRAKILRFPQDNNVNLHFYTRYTSEKKSVLV